MEQNGTIEKYADAWSDTLTAIWQEKILKLKISNTGNLYQSIFNSPVQDINGAIMMTHRFVEYGLYVDAGVGKGFKHDNGGDLGFTPKRKPKPWFHIKYYASYMKLCEDMTDILGKQAAEIIVTNIK